MDNLKGIIFQGCPQWSFQFMQGFLSSGTLGFYCTKNISEKAKNPLTCSRKRKVQKISPRHQSKRLKPRGVRGTTDKRKTLSIPAKGKPESKRYNERL